LGVIDHILGKARQVIQSIKIPQNLIHVAHKNFLTAQNNKKKRQEPKVGRGKRGGIGDAVSQTAGAKNTNWTQCSTVTLRPTFGVAVSQFWVDR
jgi:hypothetical protein